MVHHRFRAHPWGTPSRDVHTRVEPSSPWTFRHRSPRRAPSAHERIAPRGQGAVEDTRIRSGAGRGRAAGARRRGGDSLPHVHRGSPRGDLRRRRLLTEGRRLPDAALLYPVPDPGRLRSRRTRGDDPRRGGDLRGDPAHLGDLPLLPQSRIRRGTSVRDLHGHARPRTQLRGHGRPRFRDRGPLLHPDLLVHGACAPLPARRGHRRVPGDDGHPHGVHASPGTSRSSS